MTETRERRDTGTGTGLGPPWDVIVLNSNPSPMNVTFSPALV